MHPHRSTTWLAAALALLVCAAPGLAAPTFPDRPGQREFVADLADLLPDAAEARLRKQLDALLTDQAIPIIVVTIDSLSTYDAADLSIEAYARLLFDHWGIGHPRVRVKGDGVGREATASWNHGILLLVSVGDRKARIELGADWKPADARTAQRVMDRRIIPAFKVERFADGIESGVAGLEALARGEQPPIPPRPWWHYALIVAFVALMIGTIISLLQNGSSGWAWVFWGIVFSVLGTILYHLLTSRSSSGFGGGSFGGGFSGGLGASGSW